MFFRKQIFLVLLLCVCLSVDKARSLTTAQKNKAPYPVAKIQKPALAKKLKALKESKTVAPITDYQVKKGLQKDKNKKLILSGTKKKLIKSHLKRITSPFPSGAEIDFIISQYYREKSKNNNQQCPPGYDLKNSSFLYGEIEFVSLKKNSCLGKEAEEVYHLSKKLKIEKADKKYLILGYSELLKWMLDLFFYPFFPAFFINPPEEFKIAKLEQSCPSCSFKYEYEYKEMEGGFINFDVKAKCGDRKYPLSKMKQDNYFINNWKCVKNLI